MERLRSINFFRATVMCSIGVRPNGRGVVFTVVKKEKEEQRFRDGQRWRAVLSLNEVGAVLLLTKKDEAVSFYHDYSRVARKQGGSGGRRIQFRRTEKGDTEFGIYDRERGDGITFIFSPSEWIVVRLYLSEALRWCFYAVPPLRERQRSVDNGKVNDNPEDESVAIDDNENIDDEAEEEIYDLI